MRTRRVLASILVVALGGVSVGVATAWYSDSGTIEYQISAASDFGSESDEKVWVCKLIGPPHDPQVMEGKNPIHVSLSSIHAEEGFSDAHPSYVVEHGDVECSVPEESVMDRGSPDEEQVEPTSPSPETSTSSTTTSTTSTSTSTTSTSTTTTTTTTSISTTTTTTTTPPDN